ncbi:AMP-binding protein [Saccharothrix sp. BKS2]|uniref:AMP-binding protein n=1 Tax=Saccharothrix sp. BKS2 TaxID=3064400 RepID=UPI0039E7DA4A
MELAPSAHEDTTTRGWLLDVAPAPDLVPEPDHRCPLNAAGVLDDAVRGGADRRCLVTDSGTWSYGDLLARANQVAGALVRRWGLRPGNRVLLHGPNTPWYAACYLGVLRAGGVVVPVPWGVRAREVAPIAELTEVDLAVADARYAADLAELAQRVDVLLFGAEPTEFGREVDAGPDAFAPVRTSADDVAVVDFTSGSTGAPKCAMHLHRDLVFAALNHHRMLDLSPDDLVASNGSIAFGYLLGALVLAPLARGAAALFVEDDDFDAFFDAAHRHRATVFASTPGLYRRGLRTGAPVPPGLRIALSGGEKLDQGTRDGWLEATGAPLVDHLGTTELMAPVIGTPRGEAHRRDTLGRAMPGFRVRVLDDEGHEVPVGRPGRLAVRGASGCLYVKDPVAQAEGVRDGWTHTGDRATLDADGHVVVHGRGRDLVMVDGINVATTEVETVLRALPAVADVAVVGVPDACGVTALVAFVTPTGVDRGLVGLVREHARRELAQYKQPRVVRVLDRLPRNARNKVDHRALAEVARAAVGALSFSGSV